MSYLTTGRGAVSDAHRPRVVRRRQRGRRGSGRGLARATRDRRHDARLREVPSDVSPDASTCAPIASRSASAAAGPARSPSNCQSRSGALQALPDSVDATLGALVEPGANATRAVLQPRLRAGKAAARYWRRHDWAARRSDRRARGSDVHLLGRSDESLDFARSIGFENVWTLTSLPALAWDAVVDASNSPDVPARARRARRAGSRASSSSAWRGRRAWSTVARSR